VPGLPDFSLGWGSHTPSPGASTAFEDGQGGPVQGRRECETLGEMYTTEKEKMKLYIIGNGFDREHGLATTYWDFRGYLESCYPDFLSEFEEH